MNFIIKVRNVNLYLRPHTRRSMAPEFNYLASQDYQTTSLINSTPAEKLQSSSPKGDTSTVRKSGDGESASCSSEQSSNQIENLQGEEKVHLLNSEDTSALPLLN